MSPQSLDVKHWTSADFRLALDSIWTYSLSYPAVWCGSAVSLGTKVILSVSRRPRGPAAWTSARPGRASSSAAAASFLIQLDDVVQRHVHLVRQRSHRLDKSTPRTLRTVCVLLSPVARWRWNVRKRRRTHTWRKQRSPAYFTLVFFFFYFFVMTISFPLHYCLPQVLNCNSPQNNI